MVGQRMLHGQIARHSCLKESDTMASGELYVRQEEHFVAVCGCTECPACRKQGPNRGEFSHFLLNDMEMFASCFGTILCV